MNGYMVTVHKIIELPEQQNARYPDERKETIFEQRLDDLDMVALVAVLNGLNPTYRIINHTISAD